MYGMKLMAGILPLLKSMKLAGHEYSRTNVVNSIFPLRSICARNSKEIFECDGKVY